MTDQGGPGTDDLRLVAEEFGQLVAITFSEFEPGWVESVHFDFESGHLRVGVDGDYDTIRWEVGPKRDAAAAGAPGGWEELLSSEARWIWLMTNHRGFTDGLQIEFNDDQSTAIQLMAEASRLWLRKLSGLSS